MKDFTVSEVQASKKLLALVERESGVTGNTICRIVGFDEGSVYSGSSPRLSGILVIVGPQPRAHVFLRAGLTYKHYGQIDYVPEVGGVITASELGEYILKHHKKLFAGFQQCVNTVLSDAAAHSKAVS